MNKNFDGTLPAERGFPDVPFFRGFGSIQAAIFLASIVTKIPFLNSWWCLDDWGQLARASGLTSAETPIPARWLSQHFYWMATWPLFGLEATPYAISRILIHGLSAVTVSRISKNAGLGPAGSLVAGLVFAASPISFTALYWGSGIQELLGGAFALFAIERWMTDSRKAALLATLFGVLSMLSKECGLGLPVLMAAMLIWKNRGQGRKQHIRWISVVILFLAGIFESILVLKNFPTGINDPYNTGGLLVVIGNLGKFGWWLLSQGPVFTGQVTWTLAGVGLAFFVLWASWAYFAFCKGRYLPAAALLAAVLSLAPVLVLVHQARPYMGYLAMACLSLSIGCLWPTRWKPGVLLRVALVSAAVVWGLWGMSDRTQNMSDDGLPTDPIVRAMERSRSWAQYFKDNLPQSEGGTTFDVVVLQQPLRPEDISRAKRLGEGFVLDTPPHKIIGGASGLALMAGKGNMGYWVNSLMGVPPGAFVFAETSNGFKAWGQTRDALVYASLLDVLVGNFQRARSQLQLAAEIDDRFNLFNYDPDILRLPMSVFRKQSGRFIEELLMVDESRSANGYMETPEYRLFLDVLQRIREFE